MTRALLLLAALAGCAAEIESADETEVKITYNNLVEGPDSLAPLAAEACAERGRLAVYRGTTTGEEVLGVLTNLPLTARFDCQLPEDAS